MDQMLAPQISSSHSPIGLWTRQPHQAPTLADGRTLGGCTAKRAISAPLSLLEVLHKALAFTMKSQSVPPVLSQNPQGRTIYPYLGWTHLRVPVTYKSLVPLITSPPRSIGHADGIALEVDANATSCLRTDEAEPHVCGN